MFYHSTRSETAQKVKSAEAIKLGIADDGGLFVPETIPALTSDDIAKVREMNYPERAAYVLSKFLSDYTYDELLADCKLAYSESGFPGGAAPLKKINDTVYSLELWHGPTSAFKDMALQIMPKLLSRALVKTGEERTAFILVATSGDTGKAALEGYRDVDHTRITVFYPCDGVSRVQKLQMATQTGNNVSVCAIRGNFDDAQTGVKKIFADDAASNALNEKGYFFSSANSINWGRLAPQIVYYVSAYCDMLNDGTIKAGEKVNVCVPTGNFGNIFAAYIAKFMGLPIERLICASNQNNILTDFIATGTYDRNRPFHTSISPSMDILISSNLERLLYVLGGSEKTASYMKALSSDGKYTVDPDIKAKIDANFSGYYCDEENTAKTIKATFDKYGYLCDTHTAVGLNCAEQYIEETDDNTKIILASTASPFKFASDVFTSLTGKAAKSEFSALEELRDLTGVEIPYPLRDLDKKEVRFDKIIDRDDMKSEIIASL